MKIGLYGLLGSGRKTVFDAVSLSLRARDEAGGKRKGGRLEVVQVPDARLTALTEMFNPKKTTPARLTYVLPDETVGQTQMIAELAALYGLIFVVRNFTDLAGQAPSPAKDLAALEDELILRDLGVAESRLERLKQGKAKGVEALPGEEEALSEALALLNDGRPIRLNPEIAAHPSLKQYAFLSAKPRLIVANNAEGDDSPPDLGLDDEAVLVLQAQLEKELAEMEPEEAAEFRADYGLTEPGLNRLVQASLQMLDVVSFFTVGSDEVRAWTVGRDAPAAKAAGVIHTDMEKGFIRAEVVAFDDLLAAGSLAEAKKRGVLRLEGKDYPVKDGDVITIRFNV